jgi:TonB-linked SusC/RagA family outer membrane protein
MSKRIALLTFFLFLIFLLAHGQGNIKVSGRITGEKDGLPIPGATIILKGTQTGTISDAEGIYTIETPSDGSLVFSTIGYVTQEIPVNGRQEINVVLAESVTELDEVVVVGYGTQKVKDLTSSITTVKSEELLKTPSGQAMQGLQGKVAGMQVVSAGAPGSSPAIRIRGIGTFTGLKNEAPLYIVDGMFFDNIDFLNPTDIASISILKDASAAAIYGVRAANGVVLIETKSGAYNQKAEISYDGYYGVQVAQNVVKMANAEQFTTMALESGSTADASFIQNAMQRYGRSRVNPNVPDVNTDWYREILRTAAIQNHSLSASGGNQNAMYYIGANYFAQEGILDMKNEYERFNLRLKMDFKANKWLTLGGTMVLSNAIRYGEEADAWRQAYYAVPILPVLDTLNTDATPIPYANAQDIGYRSGQNPFPTLEFSENRLKIRKTMANFYARIDFLPDKLYFKTTYNHAFTSLDERLTDLPYFIGPSFQRPDASVRKSYSNYSDQIWDNVLTYTNDFGLHNLALMAGSSYKDEAYNNLYGTGLNFPFAQEETWYINLSLNKPSDGVGDGGARQYGISYFGRLSYNFDNKYLFYSTIRADGSSKYQEKWGYFPTFGAGWVISRENFLKDITVINFLKLRASWGQLGNDKIQASDGAITDNIVYTAIDDNKISGIQTSNTFSWLEWEVVEETNIGLSSRLLDNRLSVEADYYVRNTNNAALNVVQLDGQSYLRSKGVIKNSGFELALNWTDEITAGVRYNLGANFSTLKNEVVDLYGQPYLDGGMAEFRQRSIEGEPLLAFYGYEVVGVYQNQADIDADPSAPDAAVPGDFKYKDQQSEGETGYGVINDDDRVILGSYLPSIMYGANLGISWKNFDLSASIYGQAGNKILNRKRGEVIWTADQNMDADLAINRWHGEGTSNKYPSSAGLRRGWNQKMSDYLVEDGSFFRIQNVQLAYNIVGKELDGVEMPDITIAFTADRPLTLFKYNGFNPEVANGIDEQTYPIPAVYTIGLSIKF